MEQKTDTHHSDVYTDLDFHKGNFGDSKTAVHFGDEKVTIDGTLSFTYTDQDKYGEEIILQVWGREHEISERNGSDYDRMEVYFDVDQLDDMIEFLQDLKKRLNGEHLSACPVCGKEVENPVRHSFECMKKHSENK